MESIVVLTPYANGEILTHHEDSDIIEPLIVDIRKEIRELGSFAKGVLRAAKAAVQFSKSHCLSFSRERECNEIDDDVRIGAEEKFGNLNVIDQLFWEDDRMTVNAQKGSESISDFSEEAFRAALAVGRGETDEDRVAIDKVIRTFVEIRECPVGNDATNYQHCIHGTSGTTDSALDINAICGNESYDSEKSFSAQQSDSEASDGEQGASTFDDRGEREMECGACIDDNVRDLNEGSLVGIGSCVQDEHCVIQQIEVGSPQATISKDSKITAIKENYNLHEYNPVVLSLCSKQLDLERAFARLEEGESMWREDCRSCGLGSKNEVSDPDDEPVLTPVKLQKVTTPPQVEEANTTAKPSKFLSKLMSSAQLIWKKWLRSIRFTPCFVDAGVECLQDPPICPTKASVPFPNKTLQNSSGLLVVSPEQPPAADDPPANSSELLATSADPPANSSEPLATATAPLVASLEKSTASFEQPETSSTPLATPSESLAISCEQPTAATVPLANSSSPLATSTEPLVASCEKLAASFEQPATSSEPLTALSTGTSAVALAATDKHDYIKTRDSWVAQDSSEENKYLRNNVSLFTNIIRRLINNETGFAYQKLSSFAVLSRAGSVYSMGYDVLSERQKERMCLKIQKAYRRWRNRKMNEFQTGLENTKPTEEVTALITKMQAVARGMLTRKRIRAAKNSAYDLNLTNLEVVDTQQYSVASPDDLLEGILSVGVPVFQHDFNGTKLRNSVDATRVMRASRRIVQELEATEINESCSILSGKRKMEEEHSVPFASKLSGAQMTAENQAFESKVTNAVPSVCCTTTNAPLTSQQKLRGTSASSTGNRRYVTTKRDPDGATPSSMSANARRISCPPNSQQAIAQWRKQCELAANQRLCNPSQESPEGDNCYNDSMSNFFDN